MKQKTLNLVLAVAATGLVSLAVFQRRSEEAAATAAVKKGEPLTPLRSADVDHIAIRHPGAAEILLEKKEGRWRMVAPVQAAADTVEVGKVLALATAKTQGKLEIAKIRRPDLGLEPPAYSVSLNDTSIAIGGVEALKYARYVEVDAGAPDDRIAMIDDVSESATDADYSDLLAKTLLPQNADIVRIEVPGLGVSRTGNGGWTAQPATTDATSDALQTFVDLWREARSVSNEALPAGKDAARPETATVRLADGSAYTFLILGRGKQVQLARADLKLRYVMPETDAERLLKLPHLKPPKPAKSETPTAGGPSAATTPK